MVERSPRTGLPIIKKAPPRWSARCADQPPPELLEAIAQFNAGHYWQCHETLEALWRHEVDPIRSLYQGILLIGVGYYHRQGGNLKGAAAKLTQGLERLTPFRPSCMGVDVEGLARAADADVARLRAVEAGERLPAPASVRIVVRG